MGAFHQIFLLLWKNFTLHKRRPWSTVFELTLPVLFMVILVGIRQTDIDQDILRCGNHSAPGCNWSAFTASNASKAFDFDAGRRATCPDGFIVYYTGPPGNSTEQIILKAKNASLITFKNATFAQNEADMLSAIAADPGIDGCKVGIVFTQVNNSNLFHYVLRFSSTPGGEEQNSRTVKFWNTQFSFPFFSNPGPRSTSQFGSSPNYAINGFLAMQQVINLGITSIYGTPDQMTALESMMIQRFPSPPYNDDPFVNAIKFGLPMLLMLSFLFTAINIVRSVVLEKERRLKESMKMMGLKNWVHWTAWFIDFFLFLLISVFIITVLVKIGKVLQYSDATVIFVFLMVFAIVSIAFCFLVSVFFSKASTGAAFGGIMWFLCYIPYTFISPRYDTMTAGSKQGACMLSTTCMSMGAYIIATMEAQGAGVTWDNISTPPSIDDDFSFSNVISMMIFDAFFYGLLAWYIEGVYPGDYGVPHPWYFPLQPSYWCAPKPNKDEDMPLLRSGDSDEDGEKFKTDPASFERDPEGVHAGISVRGLHKIFGPKTAVHNMWLNMYEGQVTALLGHNGAGKTTTMSIITGLFPPTYGTALISGHDIRDSISEVQQKLGICPQHDVLFDSLTVAEHLWFFCRLKGVPSSETSHHIDSMIQDLELTDKRSSPSSTLSGGMKRKLSTGIALVGGSKVVILDEPTSGMDPSARRATWDLISKHKTGRTILLSTHFMDEADLLGDRIAIMSDGVVKCAGSSLFLKGRYGVGYHLTIVKMREPGSQQDICRLPELQRLVATHVPTAQLVGNVGAELTFILPKEVSGNFPALFTEMENNRLALGIESFGASVTTMEEVFLKVGETGADTNEINIQSRIEKRQAEVASRPRAQLEISPTNDNYAEEEHLLSGSIKRNNGWTLSRQQFYAMLVKRCYHSIRNKSAIITQLALPLLFTLISLVVAKTLPGPTDSQMRQLTNLGQSYGSNTVAFQNPGNFPIVPYLNKYAGSGPANASTTAIDQFLLDQAGTNSRNVAYFYKTFAVAATLTAKNPIAWFNDQAYHSSAESVQVVTNAILGASNIVVLVDNYPLPRTLIEQAMAAAQDPQGFSLAFSILFGMSFLASSFVLFLVAERANKAKHIQFVSGVNAFSYWCSAFLWDYLNYLVPVIGILILFGAFSIEEFTGVNLFYVLLQFLFYGFAIIPLMYLASFIFIVTSTAYARLTMFNIVTGLAGLLTVTIFSILNPSTADTLKSVFVFLPNFSFGQGIADIYSNYDNQQVNPALCAQLYPLSKLTLQQCCDALAVDSRVPTDQSCQTNYLAWDQPGIGRYLVVMFIEGLVFFALVILIEMRIFSRIFQRAVNDDSGRSKDLEDEDVAAERLRVSKLDPHSDEDVLVVKDLKKIYSLGFFGGSTKLAVDGVSFGVPRGECFGLLGVNGAGKTTTFGMLTGDLTVSKGNAFVEQFSILNQMRQVRQRLGYCPQFDGLIDLMTGREVLVMYARLRGVSERSIPVVVDDLIQSLMLEKHADKFTGTYSGGNKRKLSTAIALIGDPAIVFLDEPTTGMDPGARRFLWDQINATVRQGRSIILTSHSMEECEALCTRLAIMVNGRFQCIGSPQHLKTRFGRGFSLTARVPGGLQANTVPLKQFLARHLPDCSIKEEHQGYVKFVVGQSIKLAKLFELFEEAKRTLGLEDYSVSQTSLEQVFLDFAKHQVEDMRVQ